jgi:hypothetical protein
MNIKISLEQATSLPVDGVPEGLAEFVEPAQEDPAPDQEFGPVEEEAMEEDTVVFVEHDAPVDQSALLRETLWSQAENNPAVDDALPFPDRDESPINEFETNEIFSLVFPTLFPLGISICSHHRRQSRSIKSS